MEAVKTAAQRRILFFADASSVHTRRWVQSMVERSFECFVATRLPASIPGAADVIALAPGHGAAGWFSAIPQVRALARRIHPQWLHGHYVTSYGLWAAACDYPAPKLLTAWGSDILVTPRARGWRGRAMRALVGWSLRRASLITADSQDVLAEIRRYRVHARCEEVLWGVDIDRFAPGTVAAAGFEVVGSRLHSKVNGQSYAIGNLETPSLKELRQRAQLALGSLAGNELFWEVDERYWHRHASKPGLTGLAQVRGYRGETREREDLANRLHADLEYLNGWTIWRDISILINTLRVIVHRNAY